MHIVIDEGLKAKCRRTALACVEARVEVKVTTEELMEELKKGESAVSQLAEPRAVLEAPQILATRAAYKALGKDPARYRGSAEALLRRVIAGKGLPRINTVVDIINLVSVESRFSIGLYDLGRVQGDMVFRAGQEGESYKGIGKYELNLEGLPVFSDGLGPHGSPTSDSERTMVTGETERVVAIIISFSGTSGLAEAAGRLGDLMKRYADGQNEETVIVT